MRAEDAAQASQIDREAFPTQWPALSFKHEMGSKGTLCLVAWEEEEDASPEGHPAEHDGNGRDPGYVQRLVTRMKDWLSPDRQQELIGNQHIVGYAIIKLKPQLAHLTSIAVRKAFHRKGLGELLLISVIDMSTEYGAPSLTLEVRASNYPAQRLYKKYGFFEVRRYPGYYTDNGEDALIMYTDCLASAAYRSQFQELKKAYLLKRGKSIVPDFKEQLAGFRSA